MIKWLRHFLQKKETEKKDIQEEVFRENKFLPFLRNILEQVLKQYELGYGEFHPLLVDTDTPPESMLSEDDVEQVLEQISKDLNFLQIITDRPAYFSYYVEKMYEDSGLVVQLEGKDSFSLNGVNVVLDMERKGDMRRECMKENIHYIPIYKKSWSQGENLDISIPIGYNTVIVKGI